MLYELGGSAEACFREQRLSARGGLRSGVVLLFVETEDSYVLTQINPRHPPGTYLKA